MATYRKGATRGRPLIHSAHLGGSEQKQKSPHLPSVQPLPDKARLLEAEAKLLAREALRLKGAQAFNSAALASHKARRAVALMLGGAE